MIAQQKGIEMTMKRQKKNNTFERLLYLFYLCIFKPKIHRSIYTRDFRAISFNFFLTIHKLSTTLFFLLLFHVRQFFFRLQHFCLLLVDQSLSLSFIIFTKEQKTFSCAQVKANSFSPLPALLIRRHDFMSRTSWKAISMKFLLS